MCSREERESGKQMEYLDFLKTKMEIAKDSGFQIGKEQLNQALKPHQKDAVQWALRGGRRARGPGGDPDQPGETPHAAPAADTRKARGVAGGSLLPQDRRGKEAPAAIRQKETEEQPSSRWIHER